MHLEIEKVLSNMVIAFAEHIKVRKTFFQLFLQPVCDIVITVVTASTLDRLLTLSLQDGFSAHLRTAFRG